MDRSFWESRWREHRIGFHRQDVNPHLEKHAATWLAAAGLAAKNVAPEFGGVRVLVPLCGKSVDLLWLAERGARVVGVEFVEQAAREFFEQLQVTPEVTVESWGKRMRFDNSATTEGIRGDLQLWVSDFFALPSEALGPVHAVYDRAALVAVTPERRPAYVEQLERLTREGTTLLVISFEHDGGDGPPFSVPPQEVRALFASSFEGELLGDEDILASEPRFVARGLTFLREQVWLFTRR